MIKRDSAGMVERDIKDDLANGYMAIVCPACGEKKRPLRWLCLKCRNATTPSKENDDVTEYCAKHLDAVQRVIELAKAKSRG